MSIFFNNKIINKIGIDMDGVVIKHFLNIEWRSKKSSHSSKIPSKLFLQLDKYITKFFTIFRKPINGVEKSLKLIKSKDVSVVLVSARHKLLASAAKSWLNKYNMTSFFDRLYFNEDILTPFEFKKQICAKEDFDMFVDDDYIVCERLKDTFPNLLVVKMNSITNENHKLDTKDIIECKDWNELCEKITF